MKRAFDFGAALVGLVILSPLLAVIALAVKLSSPGSILYAQTRVGLHGRHFKLYKFRSMVTNADKLGTSVTTSVDRRITPVGRFLRKTKLDELPQLWNVVRGDMSLVGPRPDVPEIVATYTPEMRRIFEVLPGMTSQASLYLRDEEQLLSLTETPDDLYVSVLVPAKVDLAMEHVQRQSFWFDLLILVKTLAAVAFGRLWSLHEPVGLTVLRESFKKKGNAKRLLGALPSADLEIHQ
jgi:lipopolysaccharide/colanic/teichoic acid biosynthesis glycosyltransferase